MMKRDLRTSFDDDVNKELEKAMEEEIRENILGTECEEMPTIVESTVTVQTDSEVIDIADESDSEECVNSNNNEDPIYIPNDDDIPNEGTKNKVNNQVYQLVQNHEGTRLPLNGETYVIATGKDIMPQNAKPNVKKKGKTPLPPRKGSIKSKSRGKIRSPDCEIIDDNVTESKETNFSKHLIVHASLNKDPGITENSLIELALHMPDGRVLHFNTIPKKSGSVPNANKVKITEKMPALSLQNQKSTATLVQTSQKDFLASNMVKNVLPKPLNSPTKVMNILPTQNLLNTTTGLSSTPGLKQIVVSNSETGINNPTLFMQTVPYIQPVTSGTKTSSSGGGVTLVASDQLLTSKAVKAKGLSPNRNVQQPVRLLLPKSGVGSNIHPLIVTGVPNQNSINKSASNTSCQLVNSPVNNVVLQTTGNTPEILGCLIQPSNQNVNSNMGVSTGKLQPGNSQLIYVLQQPTCVVLPKPNVTTKMQPKGLPNPEIKTNSADLTSQLIAESLKSLKGLGKRKSDQSVAVTKRTCVSSESTQNDTNKSVRKMAAATLSPKNGLANSILKLPDGSVATIGSNLMHHQTYSSGPTTLQVIPLHALQQPASNVKSMKNQAARVAEDDSVKTSNESGYDSDVEIVSETVAPSSTK